MKCCRSIKLQKAKDKFSKRETRFVAPRGRAWGVGGSAGKGNWMKAVRRYKLPVMT